jgi:YidC/Oxa1 family membrane protein insertase
MEKRVLLAIFLSFLVLYAYQALFVPVPVPSEAPTVATTPASAEPAGGAKPDVPAPPVAAVDTTPSTALVGEASERDIRVETAHVIATFTNRGARLKSWRLKRYLDDRGESLELIPSGLAETHPLPFSLRVPDEAATGTLNSALYALAGTPPSGVATTEQTLTFEYRDTTGLHAVKEFRLQPSSYVVNVRASVSVNDQTLPSEVAWGPALASTGTVASTWIRTPGGLTYLDELERLAPDAIAAEPVREAAFRYVGVDDHYFITVAVNPGPSKVRFQVVAVPPPAGSDQASLNLVAYAIEPAQGTSITFFAGPKDFDLLAAVDPELVRAVDYGMFAFLVVPLLRSLNWIQGYVGNYGFSIIILTILINAVMFPLRHKSVVSMRKMQEIQPEAKAIQERYAKLKATDPARQKMNQELMALYRERGVNPASGCVPMLLTLPVLLAFYSLLTVSIELRGAPFFGWIHDLSHPDPYYVTPILMGVTQFWQMRLTPQTGVDPAQQKLMQFMPVLFMFFFLWAPAGVVLYWFISNLWAIGQQYLTNYIIGPPNVRSVRPPAERRMKRVGAGRTDDAAGRET